MHNASYSLNKDFLHDCDHSASQSSDAQRMLVCFQASQHSSGKSARLVLHLYSRPCVPYSFACTCVPYSLACTCVPYSFACTSIMTDHGCCSVGERLVPAEPSCIGGNRSRAAACRWLSRCVTGSKHQVILLQSSVQYSCSHNTTESCFLRAKPIQSDTLLLLVHHTSYIIHHTSYIIHHTSYIIHHTSYIIHHTSYIIHHTQTSCKHVCPHPTEAMQGLRLRSELAGFLVQPQKRPNLKGLKGS